MIVDKTYRLKMKDRSIPVSEEIPSNVTLYYTSKINKIPRCTNADEPYRLLR